MTIQSIPTKWDSVRLEDIAFVERGKFSARPRNDPKYFGGAIPFLQTGDVSCASSGGVVEGYSQTLNDAGLAVSKLFAADTLLITIAANIGDIAEVPFEFACTDSLVAVTALPTVNRLWLKHFLTTKKVYFKSKSTQNAQANINLQTIRPLLVSLPPLPEQKAIADVLNSWDKGIRKLEAKLAVKHHIKKGLMQTLLSGKQRLDNFGAALSHSSKQDIPEGWKQVKLGDVVNISKGKQLNRIDQTKDGAYPVLNGGVAPLGYTEKWNTNEFTITISEGGNSCGFVNFVKQKFWCGGHCYALSGNNGVSNAYLFQFLKYKQVDLMRLRVGSGLPNIQKKSVVSFMILLPSPKEQQAIAEVLDAAERELDALERKLSNWKAQKKYLLNNLVDGTIRLPQFINAEAS